MALPAATDLAKERALGARSRKMTPGEQVFWAAIRDGTGHWKWRRQCPIGVWIADFYCHKAKIVVELDGAHQMRSGNVLGKS
jgi:very-short-patch-repair endonuclease